MVAVGRHSGLTLLATCGVVLAIFTTSVAAVETDSAADQESLGGLLQSALGVAGNLQSSITPTITAKTPSAHLELSLGGSKSAAAQQLAAAAPRAMEALHGKAPATAPAPAPAHAKVSSKKKGYAPAQAPSVEAHTLVEAAPAAISAPTASSSENSVHAAKHQSADEGPGVPSTGGVSQAAGPGSIQTEIATSIAVAVSVSGPAVATAVSD
eukprot:jgi/Botrbrau1/10070/Bobra.0355s0025.1